MSYLYAILLLVTPNDMKPTVNRESFFMTEPAEQICTPSHVDQTENDKSNPKCFDLQEESDQVIQLSGDVLLDREGNAGWKPDLPITKQLRKTLKYDNVYLHG
jgi:hypothetical protein